MNTEVDTARKAAAAGHSPLGPRGLAGLRVAVVHGDPIYVAGFRSIAEEPLGIEVRAIDPDRDVLEDELERFDAQIVVVELSSRDDLGRVEALRRDHPEVGIVVLTDGDHDRSLEAVAAGANGVLSRRMDPAQLDATLSAAAADLVVLDRELLEPLLGSVGQRQRLLRVLDDDQLALLELISDGTTIADIAEMLFVSARTVKRRLSDLYDALDVEGRAEAIHKGGCLALTAGREPTGDEPHQTATSGRNA